MSRDHGQEQPHTQANTSRSGLSMDFFHGFDVIVFVTISGFITSFVTGTGLFDFY